MIRQSRLTILAGLLVSLIALSAAAQATLPSDFSPDKPTIGSATFKITDFGAVGDGTTLNTDAITKAISACAKSGGGTVVVPQGVFLTKPFSLASNLDFHLEAGATILFPAKTSDYQSNRDGYENCIVADGCHDLAITGEGSIDGQGADFWRHFVKNPPPGAPPQLRRPNLVVLTHCRRVLVQGVTLTNSPMFHLVPSACKGVTIDGIHIKAPAISPNTDGIDPSGINFLIAHCTIDTGDDCIALKAGIQLDPQQPSCENFLIRDCTFLHGHGMSIGSESYGGAKNMIVRDCTFDGTDAGIRLKSGRGRGGLVEDLSYENLTMTNVKVSILITSYYPSIPKAPQGDPAQAVTDRTPIWRKIRITNVTSTGGKTAGQIVGLPEMPIEDVVLTNVHISADKPIQIVNAKGIHFVDSQISGSSGGPVVVDSEVEGLANSEQH